MRFNALVLLLLATSISLADSSDAQVGYSSIPGGRVVLDVKVPMRDGIKLSADIYFPEGNGPFPVVLVRTPYDNSPLAAKGLTFAKRGYVYVAQDCRGRFDSEGIYYPWIQEVPDGLDTKCRKWIAKQAWCNGKIATIGGSYLGVVQWFGVQESSEYLVTAMMPSVTPTDGWKCGDNAFYVNGAFQLPVLAWGLSNQSRTRQPTDVYVDWEALFRYLPLMEMDRVATGNTVPFVRDWIKHSSYDDYWRRISLENKFDQIMSPFITSLVGSTLIRLRLFGRFPRCEGALFPKGCAKDKNSSSGLGRRP